MLHMQYKIALVHDETVSCEWLIGYSALVGLYEFGSNNITHACQLIHDARGSSFVTSPFRFFCMLQSDRTYGNAYLAPAESYRSRDSSTRAFAVSTRSMRLVHQPQRRSVVLQFQFGCGTRW